MFKNRSFTIKVNRPNEDAPQDPTLDAENFEIRSDAILRKIERLGAKMFLGVCIYIALDTRRQVAVARANNQPCR
jgi:hypothetical protein